MQILANARRYTDLLEDNAPESVYDYATLFPEGGFLARGRAKKRFKLLKKIDSRVQSILRPEERVFFATVGTTQTVIEQFFLALPSQYLNRRAIVFTTDRLLLIQVDSRNNAKDLISQIRYEEITAVRSTWHGLCQICLRNGKKLSFQRVHRADRKFLHHFLKDIIQPIPGEPGQKCRAPEHLCPACYTVVSGHPSACPHCAAAFKSAQTAALLSLGFPGLGDFHLGHRGFALLETFGGIFVWLVFVISPLLMSGTIDPETGEIIEFDAPYWIFAALAVTFTHVVDSVTTLHFAKKGHYPKGGKPPFDHE